MYVSISMDEYACMHICVHVHVYASTSICFGFAFYRQHSSMAFIYLHDYPYK